MSEISVERGLCLGFGGTNARVGVYEEGAIVGFNSAPTPEDPEFLNGWPGKHSNRQKMEANGLSLVFPARLVLKAN